MFSALRSIWLLSQLLNSALIPGKQPMIICKKKKMALVCSNKTLFIRNRHWPTRCFLQTPGLTEFYLFPMNICTICDRLHKSTPKDQRFYECYLIWREGGRERERERERKEEEEEGGVGGGGGGGRRRKKTGGGEGKRKRRGKFFAGVITLKILR